MTDSTRQNNNSLRYPMLLWGISFVYLAITSSTQLLVSGTADLDQSEQLVLSQDFQLGYSSQPPLYTWLVKGILAVTGPNLWPLMGLKVLLISLIIAALLGIGRQFSFSRQQHLITLVSIIFIPQFIWESQRDLTHSVLATALSAATLFQVVRIRRRPTTVNYILAGLFIGLGLLSKYNYAIFLAALTFAVFFTDQYRPVFRNSRVLLALAVAMAVVSPHVIWILQKVDLASNSANELKAMPGHYFSAIGRAAYNAVAFLTPLWIISLFLIGPGRTHRNADQAGDSRFLINLLAATAAVVAVFVLVTAAHGIRNRWYQPLLFFVPLLLGLHSGLSQEGIKRFWKIGLVAAIMVAAALNLRTVLAGDLNRYSRVNIPFPSMNSSLVHLAGEPAVIIAESNLVGGNARLFFPHSRIITPAYEGRPLTGPETALILCETEGCSNDRFSSWIQKKYDIDLDSLNFHRIEEPYYYGPSRTHVLFWTKADLLPPGR